MKTKFLKLIEYLNNWIEVTVFFLEDDGTEGHETFYHSKDTDRQLVIKEAQKKYGNSLIGFWFIEGTIKKELVDMWTEET